MTAENTENKTSYWKRFVEWKNSLTSPGENIGIIIITILQFIITCQGFANINTDPNSFYVSFFFTATYEVCYFNKEVKKLVKDLEKGFVCFYKGKVEYNPYGNIKAFGFLTIGMSSVAYLVNRYGVLVPNATPVIFGLNMNSIINLVFLICMGFLIWNHKIVMSVRDMVNRPKYVIRKIEI